MKGKHRLIYFFIFTLLVFEVGRFGLAIYILTQPPTIQNNIQGARTEIDYELSSNLLIKDVAVYKMKGFSMQPAMFTGNGVIAVAYTDQELKEGMIIKYRSEQHNGTVIHRIQGIYNDYVSTRGDNSNGFEKVQEEDIQDIIVGVLYI